MTIAQNSLVVSKKKISKLVILPKYKKKMKKECSIRNRNHCQAYRSVNLKGHLTQSAKQILT